MGQNHQRCVDLLASNSIVLPLFGTSKEMVRRRTPNLSENRSAASGITRSGRRYEPDSDQLVHTQLESDYRMFPRVTGLRSLLHVCDRGTEAGDEGVSERR